MGFRKVLEAELKISTVKTKFSHVGRISPYFAYGVNNSGLNGQKGSDRKYSKFLRLLANKNQKEIVRLFGNENQKEFVEKYFLLFFLAPDCFQLRVMLKSVPNSFEFRGNDPNFERVRVLVF